MVLCLWCSFELFLLFFVYRQFDGCYCCLCFPVSFVFSFVYIVHVDETKVDIKLECLDNLTDLLKRFGREVESEV